MITITHPVDESSPFFASRDADGTVVSALEGVAHLSCSLVASDGYGTPIMEVQQYSNIDVGFQKMLTEPYATPPLAYPSILDAPGIYTGHPSGIY